MTVGDFADELEQAADQIADHSLDDLQAILRRAAVKLRDIGGIGLRPDEDAEIDDVALDLGLSRSEVLTTIIRDWLGPPSRR